MAFQGHRDIPLRNMRVKMPEGGPKFTRQSCSQAYLEVKGSLLQLVRSQTAER